MKKRLISFSIFASTLILAINLLITRDETSTKNKSYKHTVTSSASWVKEYKNLDEIKFDADYIVEGKVKNNIKTYKMDEVVFTDSLFEIEKVYKGDITEKSIVISQDGGILDGINYKLDKVEILKPGSKYILFLHLTYPPKRDQFSIVGGWKGQYELDLIEAKNPEKEINLPKDKLIEKVTAK